MFSAFTEHQPTCLIDFDAAWLCMFCMILGLQSYSTSAAVIDRTASRPTGPVARGFHLVQRRTLQKVPQSKDGIRKSPLSSSYPEFLKSEIGRQLRYQGIDDIANVTRLTDVVFSLAMSTARQGEETIKSTAPLGVQIVFSNFNFPVSSSGHNDFRAP